MSWPPKRPFATPPAHMAAQALAQSAANAQESLTCVKCLVQLVRARAARLAATHALTEHRRLRSRLDRRCTRLRAFAACSQTTRSSVANSQACRT